MWLDRLTGKQLQQLPVEIDSGRYWTGTTGLTFNGHTPDFSGLLVDDESQRCRIGNQARLFNLPRHIDAANIELLSKAITTIDANLQQGGISISPLMPAAIVDDQGHLQSFEERLLEVVAAGHLHRISQRPRLDIHYEDELTDIARARRLSKGALVHLASHSECWHRQTLTGVIPKKVMARFSQDDYGIYENLVYARLLDKVERYLRARLSTLNSLRTTLEQAMEFYQSPDINHWLAGAVCDLWGQTFDQDATGEVTRLLSTTLNKLQGAHKTIRTLQQSGLYILIDRNAQVPGGLHRTNILSHDPDYRHVAVLWDLLGRAQTSAKVTAAERFKRNQYLAEAYSRYAGLVLRRALQPYLAGKNKGIWAGRTLELRQRCLEWELVSTGTVHAEESVLLTVVPWMTSGLPPQEVLPINRFVAWPVIGQKFPEEAFTGQWIPLSPSDMYCEERFGLLVDHVLQRLLLDNYSKSLEKVPTAVLARTETSVALYLDQPGKKIQIRELLTEDLVDEMIKDLRSANALSLAYDLKMRNEEIKALQICPVCKSHVHLAFQRPFGFKAVCADCGTERYLRGQNEAREYEQLVAGEYGFRILGRRAWTMELGK